MSDFNLPDAFKYTVHLIQVSINSLQDIKTENLSTNYYHSEILFQWSGVSGESHQGAWITCQAFNPDLAIINIINGGKSWQWGSK